MDVDQPTEFEASIFRHFAARTADIALQSQLSNVAILRRKHTGVGCYSDILTNEGAPATTAAYGSHGPLSGPRFESPRVELGGGTLLWFKDGRAVCLEIFAYGEFFPEDHADLVPFKLLDRQIDPSHNR